MIAFTWVYKLDNKFRLVVPLKVRKELGLADSVKLELIDGKVFITKPSGETGRPISKNCRKVEK